MAVSDGFVWACILVDACVCWLGYSTEPLSTAHRVLMSSSGLRQWHQNMSASVCDFKVNLLIIVSWLPYSKQYIGFAHSSFVSLSSAYSHVVTSRVCEI